MAIPQQPEQDFERQAREILSDPIKAQRLRTNIQAGTGNILEGIVDPPKPPAPPALTLGGGIPKPSGQSPIQFGGKDVMGMGIGMGLPLTAALSGGTVPLVIGAGMVGDMIRQKMQGRPSIDPVEAGIAGGASVIPVPGARGAFRTSSPIVQRLARTGSAGLMGGVTNTAFGMSEEAIQNPQAPFLERAGRAAMNYGPEGVAFGSVLHNLIGEPVLPGRRSLAATIGESVAARKSNAPQYQPAAPTQPAAPAAPTKTPQQFRLELANLPDGTQLTNAAGDRLTLRRTQNAKSGAADVQLVYPDGTIEPLIRKGVATKGLDKFAGQLGTEFQPVLGPPLPPPPTPQVAPAAAAAKPAPKAGETFKLPPQPPTKAATGRAAKTGPGVAANEQVRQEAITTKVTELRAGMAKAKDAALFLAQKRGVAKKGSPLSSALDVLDAELKGTQGAATTMDAKKVQATQGPTGAFKAGDQVTYTGKGGKVITGTIQSARSDKGMYTVQLTGATGKTSATTKHESLLKAGVAGAPKMGSKPVVDTTATEFGSPTQPVDVASIPKPAPQALLPEKAPAATPAAAAQIIKEAAAKKGVDPKAIFGNLGGGGAHPQKPTRAPGEPRSLFSRLMGERGAVTNMTAEELEASYPRRGKPAASVERMSWNDAVQAVNNAQKHEVESFRDFMKMYKEYAGEAAHDTNFDQFKSAWRLTTKKPASGRPLKPTEAMDQEAIQSERAARAAERGEFDPELSKQVAEPPTERADFETGAVEPAKAKKVAAPDKIMADAREAVKRGDYRDYNKWREAGLEHKQAMEAALEEARDAWAKDNYDKLSLQGFRKLYGKPGSREMYTKPSEGKRTAYEEGALDEGDIEGSTRSALAEAGSEKALGETVAFKGTKIRGTNVGKSQYETFKENLEGEGGLIYHGRGGSKQFYRPKPKSMSEAEAAEWQKENEFLDRMWAQVEADVETGGRGTPRYPVPKLEGKAREAAMSGEPTAKAEARVPARPPAKTFKRPLRQLKLTNIPGGKAEVAVQPEEVIKERKPYRPAAPKVTKKFTGAQTAKGAPIFESRPLLEGKPAPDRTGVKLFPAPKRLPVPEKMETVKPVTTKGERVFTELSKKGDELKVPGPGRDRKTSEFRRPVTKRGILPLERSRELPKAPKDRPFIKAEGPPTTEPARPHTVSSAVHPIGGAGYRAPETSTGKNVRTRLSTSGDKTKFEGSRAPFTVRKGSGITNREAIASDRTELSRDLKDLRGAGPRGVNRYQRTEVDLVDQGEFVSAKGLRQLKSELRSVELDAEEMNRARKYYDQFKTTPVAELAKIARSGGSSVPERVAALQSLIDAQKAKLRTITENKLNASVKQQIEAKQSARTAKLEEARAQIRAYLSTGKDYLTPQQMKAVGSKYGLDPESLAAEVNSVRKQLSLPPPPSGGGRPPLSQRLLHDDSGVIGGGAAQQIQQRRAERVAKRKTFLLKRNAPFDEQLETNRAAVEESDPGSFLTRMDRFVKKTLDTHIAYERATKLTGQDFPEGSSPLEWVHAIAGGGSGKAIASAVRLHDVEAPHWKKIPKAEWDVADQAVDYALAYEQVMHSERILQDRVNIAKGILDNARKIGVVKDIQSAASLLKYEKASLKNLTENGIGLKDSKLTPTMARQRYQDLLNQAPQAHKDLINDVINQTKKEFEQILSFRTEAEVGTLDAATAAHWKQRGAYLGGLYRQADAGADTGRAIIKTLQSRKKLTPDEANLLRQLTSMGDAPVITGRDSVYRTLFRDVRDAERAKLVNKIVKWFGDYPDLMMKAPSETAPVPEGFLPVYAWEAGKPVKYYLHNDLSAPLLGVSLLEAQLAGLNSTVFHRLNTLSARLGTSLSPAWQVITNPQRDIKAKRLATYTPEGKRAFPMTPTNAFKDLTVDYVKNFSRVAQHHPEYLDMLEHYGALSGLAGSMTPDFILEGVMKRSPKTGILGPATRGRLIVTAAARLGHTFENTPKLSGYTRLKELGVPKDTAGVIARQRSGTADLSVHGEMAPASSAFALYLNANLQEKRRWIRDFSQMLHGKPGAAGRTMGKARSTAFRRMGHILLGTSAMALANGMYNQKFRDKDGNPEIDHVPPEVLEQNWIWFSTQTTTDINGETRYIYAKSPKETPQQIFAPLVMELLHLSAKGDHEGAQKISEEWFNALFPGRSKADFSSGSGIAKSFARGAWSNVAPWLRVPANMAANMEFESGREIEPQKLRDRSPELRYTAYTNESTIRYARGLAKVGIQLSPKKLEYLVRNLGAAPGSITLDLNEAYSEWTGKHKSPAAGDPFQRAKRLPGAGVMISRALGPGNIDGAELRDNNLFYEKAAQLKTYQADTKVFEGEQIRNPQAEPSEFLNSKEGKFWEGENLAYEMNQLSTRKGEILSESSALLSEFKSPKTTDSRREEIIAEMKDLHLEEKDLLKTFKESILGEKPTIPPPPTKGFFKGADLRNKPK